MKKIWINEKGEFQALNAEQIKGLSEDESFDYLQDRLAHEKKRLKELEDSVDGKASKKDIEDLKNDVGNIRDDILKAVKVQGVAIAEQARKGAVVVKETPFRKAFNGIKDQLEKIKKGEINSGTLKFNVELDSKAVATQAYGDITDEEDYAQFNRNVIEQPVRRVRFRQLFNSIPLATEFYRYVEQDSVTRTADNVANCAAVASTTKETLATSVIEAVKIKDMIRACKDFLDDFAFMRARINKLVRQSVELKVDLDTLLGTGIAPEMNSVDSVASEFSAANAIGVLTASIQDANYIDLIMGMRMQIVELGQQNAFMPDTVVVNAVDWFKLVESKKDANNNYLDTRVVRGEGNLIFVSGMLVVTSPIVVQNTCYVFDSTQGDILDRKQLEITIAFENGTDWESDHVSIQGAVRLNLLVPNELADAFMKSTDVAAAITAITAP